MSAVLPIARDGHLRRNTLVNLKSAFARLTNKFVSFVKKSQKWLKLNKSVLYWRLRLFSQRINRGIRRISCGHSVSLPFQQYYRNLVIRIYCKLHYQCIFDHLSLRITLLWLYTPASFGHVSLKEGFRHLDLYYIFIKIRQNGQCSANAHALMPSFYAEVSTVWNTTSV